jgi:hypothetical protein
MAATAAASDTLDLDHIPAFLIPIWIYLEFGIHIPMVEGLGIVMIFGILRDSCDFTAVRLPIYLVNVSLLIAVNDIAAVCFAAFCLRECRELRKV